MLAAAQSDPAGFLRGLGGAIIDEVQLSPALLRAVKLAVDQDRRPGRFLLTGSANLLALPQVADSLAGRMEIVPLLPLSGAEALGERPRFLPLAFEGRLAVPAPRWEASALMDEVLTGGYPEMRFRTHAERRRSWAPDYVNDIVQRDIRDLAEVGRLELMPRLLRALAAHAGQLANDPPRASFFHTRDGEEVDLVLERDDGQMKRGGQGFGRRDRRRLQRPGAAGTRGRRRLRPGRGALRRRGHRSLRRPAVGRTDRCALRHL